MMECKIRLRHVWITVVAATIFCIPYLLTFHKPSVDQFLWSVSNMLVPGKDPDPVLKHACIRRAESGEYTETVLARAAMGNKTVIITTLNQAWAANNTMIDLFLESFHRGEDTENLLRHLVLVTLDQQAYSRCRQLHSHCFMLKTAGVDFSGFKPYMSEDFLKMMWRRMEFMTNILELGYSFVFSDADIVWFRNPFNYFAEDTDFQISCDTFLGSSLSATSRMSSPNCGYVYTRSSNRTIAMYKLWCAGGATQPEIDEQTQLKWLLQKREFLDLGVKVRFLNTDRFSGFCEKSKDMTKVVTMHANCCVGMEHKIFDLRLALDDWQAGKSIPPPNINPRAISLWRSPVKCHLPPRHTRPSHKRSKTATSGEHGKQHGN